MATDPEGALMAGTLLDIVYASGGDDVILSTIEMTCPAWPDALLICNGFEDQTCVTEDNRTLTFIASGMDVSLPKRDNTANQTLGFAVDNVRGLAQQRIDMAKEAEARISMTYRTYLASDKSAPAERPYFMTVLSGSMEGPTVQISAGFFDMIGAAWPRDIYNLIFSPGIKYL